MRLRGQLAGKKVVVMVTGGNIDPRLLAKVVEEY